MVYGPPELQSLIAGTLRMAPLMLTTPVVVQGWVLDPARAHAPRAVDRDGLLQASAGPARLQRGWTGGQPPKAGTGAALPHHASSPICFLLDP